MIKRVGILGSTGSIGTQALEVISQHPDELQVTVLTARNNVDLIIEQALKFNPEYIVITNPEKYTEVRDALSGLKTEVIAGCDELAEVVKIDSLDIVLTALVGFAGLVPTISALEAGKDIALANKETLVVAGELITSLARQKKTSIYPVDSEHSAIYQCLVGEKNNVIEKIFLTASGGPFRGYSKAAIKRVTREQALNHPNWCMGSKVTIDSASLMNKGLEAIEAKWLFNLNPDQIDIIVHPQSIIHSLVQFADGSIKAQLGLPDMRLPIQYALGYPKRLKNTFKRFSFTDYPQLTFEQPDREVFGNLTLAFKAMEEQGNKPCVMNAANEIAVEAFLAEKLPFHKMPDVIRETMTKVNFIEHPSLDNYLESDTEARKIAAELI